MKVKDGILSIDIQELFKDEEFCKEAAKNLVFERWLFYGITELMIKDEVDWLDGGCPSWCAVSFGRSYFEEARTKIIQHISEVFGTQVKALQEERDTIDKYYKEYLSKSIDQERIIADLSQALRVERDKNDSYSDNKF
jgi:hypothetical protein